MSCAGVLLTGGTSRRMGLDKATLAIGDESFAVHAARVMAAVCDPVIEVGEAVTGLRCTREVPAGAGPLAAFLAGVDALGVSGPAIVLACDMPFVDEGVLRDLANHPATGSVVTASGGVAQYVCARWSRAAIASARGRTAMRALLSACDATYMPIADARTLSDVDTPEDLQRLGLS